MEHKLEDTKWARPLNKEWSRPLSNNLETNFEANISLPLYTSDELTNWKDAFEQKSMSTYRVKETFPNVGQKVLFKVNQNVSLCLDSI